MSKEQLHKRYTTEQVVDIVRKYQNKEIEGTKAAAYLGLGRTRFYQIVAAVKEHGNKFSLEYVRTEPSRRINPKIEKNLKQELTIEKKWIEDPDVPIRRYNYTYIQQELQRKYEQRVSLDTVIRRAKEWDFYLGKPPKKIHDREVITHYTGELMQHDASYHLFVPLLGDKLVLTTTLDDFSRALLYADLWEKETTWNHIQAAQTLVCEYGIPYRWYMDQHAIFRYVKSRDKHSPWREFEKFTDDVDPQYKQVLKDIGIEPVYALSPQAKGKIERPYQWLQDRMVRTCMREKVTTVAGGRDVLYHLVNQYNWHWRHSTTGEIPMERYQDAIREKQSLWRPLDLKPPYADVKDIFCLRAKRIVDPYRNVSINKLKLSVPGVSPRQEVELRISPDYAKGVTEVRFWFKGTCTGRVAVKNQELPVVQF
jgi:hypothetical protein